MGSHASLRTLFSDVCHDLADNIQFGYGGLDEFNSLPNKKYPYVWLEPLGGRFPTSDQIGVLSSLTEWTVSINFFDKDDTSGNEKETQEVLDAMFDLAEKWIHKLDREFLNADSSDRIESDTIQIGTVTFIARRKGTADHISGWTLTFTCTTRSDFDYCSIYE